MISAFFAGVAFAVSHHVYYMKLNNQPVGSATRQQWPLRHVSVPCVSASFSDHPRFGTAFAFLVKTCLTAATGTAYVQWVWRRCRQKAVAIGAIDSAFAVEKNIFLFWNWDFLSDFQIPVVIAIILWYVVTFQS